jgi:hypothetical protein
MLLRAVFACGSRGDGRDFTGSVVFGLQVDLSRSLAGRGDRDPSCLIAREASQTAIRPGGTDVSDACEVRSYPPISDIARRA